MALSNAERQKRYRSAHRYVTKTVPLRNDSVTEAVTKPSIHDLRGLIEAIEAKPFAEVAVALSSSRYDEILAKVKSSALDIDDDVARQQAQMILARERPIR